ncbi:MAG: adenylate/guanylate cyclase domain-containing protein [Flavobacteriaceae bacterium]|nr:adenylate/guanylate cyclase domain-containing protein [Flavobacteriaceae bacterium]
MKKKIINYLTYLWQSILFWSIAMMLFVIIREYGIGEEDGITLQKGVSDIVFLTKILPLFALLGGVMGVIYATLEFVFEQFVSKKISIGLRTLLKVFIYFFFIIFVLSLLIELVVYLYNVPINNERGWWRTDKTFRVILLYIFLAAIVFSFIKISNEKFGKGVFLKMLFGKYKNPIEEYRIFMFLDLKSSTTIAETLGHFKYSQLIQDCFYDLNELVPKYSAEIYQYVGDEVVLSWPYKKGLANNQCVNLFFSFQDLLVTKESYYQNKYGLVPKFKAGMHGGKLMVAEVGVVKKELAFHGDVINTSARIQSECNNYGVSILVSEQLISDLNDTNDYTQKSLGSVLLKGKNEKMNIYTLLRV